MDFFNPPLISGSKKSVFSEISSEEKKLAVLIDPDKFDISKTSQFLLKLPELATHIFVGGSTVEAEKTETLVKTIKTHTHLPIVLFPGGYSQITQAADAVLFLSLISGNNPEYLIGQQLKAIPRLKNSKLEILPTGYILIDGGRESAVQKVSGTTAIPQHEIEQIVHTALAGQYLGMKFIYLEAGSGAKKPVSEEIISEVKKAINIPLLVGGGICSEMQLETAYLAGADLVVVGTAFEEGRFS